MNVTKRVNKITKIVISGALIVFSILALNGHTHAACSADTSRGAVTYSFTAPADGSYTFWARMQATSNNNDSIYISIDNGDCVTIGDADVPINAWKWVNYKDGQTSNVAAGVQLTAGVHSIKMIAREDGVKVDRIMLLTGCTPAANGNGDDCVSQNDQQGPLVSITSPSANTAQLTGAVQVSVDASDNVGVAKVEVLIDGKVNKTFTSLPYSYSLDTSAFPDGSHSISAVAYDAANNSSTSTEVVTKFMNTAAPPNKPPIVSLSSPSTSYTDPANIILTATASDSDGSVSKVEFFNGSTKIGQATESPYAMTWSNVGAGSYTITAKATDNQSATTNSQGLSLQVAKKVAAQQDTTKPSTPTSLNRYLSFDARRFKYVINLSWNASTDNVGVQNYVVKRNGVVIQKPTGTSYGDTAVSANTLYTYTVEAQDAAGNTSDAAVTKIKGSCFLVWCSESQ